MHELSVCQALIAEVAALVQRENARAVSHIRLAIGPLSGVDGALLQHAFPIAATGSVAAGASLSVTPVPLRVRCTACGADSAALPNRLVCGACGDWHTRLLSGDELTLTSVEMLVDAPEAQHV
jgi:hydrogenase nickel incorporation protein HypA/HybF